uniref:Uncharacterized AAA domain-containing protein ycf46 n=1 Tax=Schizocladia ischiensis TaxID=196139 RepID=A0A7S6U9T6_9STRA|nr:Ycf46 [Schizocladia ischiensis]QOW07476.1 Ycf46 [Schizocladia ischiensis]
MNFRQEFLLLLKARYPIIYISTFEEDRLEYTIRTIIKGVTPRHLYIWDFIDGYQVNPIHEGFGKRNPLQALELIEQAPLTSPSLFILRDFRRFLSDINISRKLKNTARVLKLQPKTIIIVDSEINIPSDLKDCTTVIKFSLPNNLEIRDEIVRLVIRMQLCDRAPEKFLEKIIMSCQGLSLEKIRRVLAKTITLYKCIDNKCIDLILQEKKQIINQTNILEFWPVKETLRDLGGVTNLKKWLAKRSKSFSELATNYGLAIPRGVLLIGIQGSGKSLVAKGVAAEWKLPLLRLDVGRLFGGIMGESESRVRQMISIAESLAPCILWVDEIDKAFAESTQSMDNGTTSRVLGTFLTWLAEKEVPVFVIATANNIYMLPVEILRKGRFDEIFFIGLPNREERRMIFKVHLSRLRPETWSKYNLDLLSRQTNDFSGAEIEQSITEAMHTAFSQKREFTTTDISKAIKQTIPLVRIDPERLDMVQEWAYSGRIRIA